MNEVWKDIPGFEGRYQVSSLGRVKALSFLQRYVHWRTRQELFRRTKERILTPHPINSGYLIVSLYKDNARAPRLVHRLVAEAFLDGPPSETVNHKNGIKTDNRAENLEWATYSENHKHAVSLGLNRYAIPVIDPETGIRYDSITQAAKGSNKAHKTVRATFLREVPNAKHC